MTLTGNTWNSFINPKDDGILGTGTIKWWIVATDKKGVSSTSAVKSIGVYRCDSLGYVADGGYDTKAISIAHGGSDISSQVTIDAISYDQDGIRSVTLYWTNSSGAGVAIVTGSTAMSGSGRTWSVVLTPSRSWKPGTLTWHMTMVDVYGNSYRSPGQAGPVTVYP